MSKTVITSKNSALLLKNFWEQPNYVKLSNKFSKDTKDDFWMKILKKEAYGKKKVLDVGSGDGTRLTLLHSKAQLWGVDLSKKAISSGKKTYPKLKLYCQDAQKMKFGQNFFDLTFTAFCLEHFTLPEKVLSEMIRVTQKNGLLIFVAPNYGSPIIESLQGKIPRIIRVLKMITKERINLSSRHNSLGWQKINPQISKPFQPDNDAVNLPYLHSLVLYLKHKGLKIEAISSGWEPQRVGTKGFIILILKKLKMLDIFPLKYWGPTLFLVCRK